MLKKSRRLNRAQFDKVRTSRTTVANNLGSLRFVAADPPGKFSVVVSKSLAKNAVSRNTARRRAYSCFGRIIAPLNAILYVRKTINSSEEIERGLIDLVELANKTAKKHT